MYADRLEAGGRLPVKDRLNGRTLDGSGRRRQISGKRQREDDDKWEHDLYEHNRPQMSRRKIGSTDLRLKLQRKSNQQASQSGKADLRERLSGIFHPQVDNDLPKPKNAPEISKPVMKNVISEAPVSATKKVSNKIIKKSQQKAGSMDSFLQSLGLEKYSITFQAEEVDMAALVHMTDEDLKAMGIPMGPRKKILLALESKS
nr:protein bicaudal C homolog 1-like [Ipomoea trifida]